MKKKIICIILAVILILLIAAGVVIFRNRSFVRILFMDTEKTQKTTIENGEEFRKLLEDELGIDFPEFTEEEKEKIATGEISVSEILIRYIEEYAEEHPELFAESDEDAESGDNSSPNGSSSQEIIVRYTGEFAALRSRYTGALDSLVGAAKAEMQPGHRTEVVSRYSGEARALEASCDAEVEALLGRMASELSAAGGDLSIIDTIRQNYAGEKAAREVYYRDKFASML